MFIGSLSEFKKFFSIYCKNKVVQMTKSIKNEKENICEYCKQKRELETVYIKGSDRINVIESILNKNFKQSETVDNYFVDLHKFEEYFIDAQKPIEKHFYFLCNDCHKKYDKNEISEDQIRKKINYTKNEGRKLILGCPVYDPFRDYIAKKPKVPLEFYKRGNESMQDYVKRLLVLCRDHNLLTPNRLAQLQDLRWCKEHIGLQYPWLEKHRWKTIVSGHRRYYKGFTLLCNGTKYFVCSQWWKDLFEDYEYNLRKWVESLFNNSLS